MQDITQGLIELFGIGEIPTDFPSFFYWFCTLVAALEFVKIIMGTLFMIYGKVVDIRK